MLAKHEKMTERIKELEMDRFKLEQTQKITAAELEKCHAQVAAKSADINRLNLAIHQLEMDKVQLRSQSDAQMKDMEMHLRTKVCCVFCCCDCSPIT